MIKGLEALKDFSKLAFIYGGSEQFKIIEDELKTLQEHEEILNSYGLNLCDFREACLLLAQWKSANLCWADYEKQKRALETIEKSGCSFEHILLIEKTKNYKEYDAQFDNYLERRYEPFKFELRKSKKEYGLLKEVLCNESRSK